MKALFFFLALGLLCFRAEAQQTISGTVTYGYYWADTGAMVYLFDSSQTAKPVLRLLEAKFAAESEEALQLQHRTAMKRRLARVKSLSARLIIMNRGDEATAYTDEEHSIQDSLHKMDEALLHFDPQPGRDSLERLAYNPSSLLFSDRSARVMHTSVTGTYSFSVPDQGVYYVLIRAINERAGVATGSALQRKYYLQKLIIHEGDKRDASTAFRL